MNQPKISNVGAKVDLLIRRGSDFTTTITFKNPDNTPISLVGSTLRAQVRKRPSDTAIAASFTVTPTDAANGVATMTMAASVTLGLTCGSSPIEVASIYAWDLIVTDSTSKTSSPLYGVVNVSDGVTR